MGVRDLIVYQKAYDAALYALPLLNRMPKSYRGSVARDLQAGLTQILIGIVAANHDPVRRKEIIRQIDIELEGVRTLLRLSHDLKLVATKQYGLLAARLDEVGRLLGGWLGRSTEGPGGARPRGSEAGTGTMARMPASSR